MKGNYHKQTQENKQLTELFTLPLGDLISRQCSLNEAQVAQVSTDQEGVDMRILKMLMPNVGPGRGPPTPIPRVGLNRLNCSERELGSIHQET